MINLSMPSVDTELRPRITVFGVGGAGGNAVNNMIKANLEGVEFVVGNTDAQALKQALAQRRVQLGSTITRGLGAGSRPDVGRAAAEEQIDEIVQHLDGSNMVFITAGMGGGTGTGAAPVIARAARERGILTVGVVTKPFLFEGAHRMRLAENGISELQQYVDTLIIIPNQNLFRIANEKTTFADAFKMADDVLHAGVKGVTDLMVMPGLINLDFADIRAVMTEMGKAMMGTGESGGERRAIQAAEAAISNPLLDEVSMKGARGVLINITGGYDMTLFEVDEAANRIRDEVDPDANIIFGSTFDPSLEGIMRVSVVATGIDAAAMAQARAAHVVQTGHAPAAGHATQAAAGAGGQAAAARGGAAEPRRPGVAPAGPARSSTPDYHSTLVAAPPPPPPAASAPPPARGVDETQVMAAAPLPPQQPAPTLVEPPPIPATPVRSGLSENRFFGGDAGTPPPPRSVGHLRGERRDGVFIAPRPVDPGPRQPAAAMESQASPLHGSSQRSAPAQGQQGQGGEGGEERPRRRAQSLFERFAGLGSRWGRESGDAAEPERVPPPAPPRGASQPQPQNYAPQPQNYAPQPQPQNYAPQPQPQNYVPQPQPQNYAPQPQGYAPPPAGLQPASKVPPRSSGEGGAGGGRGNRGDEDVLDIPAFLRRQAN